MKREIDPRNGRRSAGRVKFARTEAKNLKTHYGKLLRVHQTWVLWRISIRRTHRHGVVPQQQQWKNREKTPRIRAGKKKLVTL